MHGKGELNLLRKFCDFKYDLTWFLRLSLLLEDALLFSKNCSMRLFCFNFWKGQEVRSPTFPTSSLSVKVNWELSITSSGSFLD